MWYVGSPSVMELLKVLSTDLKAQPGDPEIVPLFLCSGRGTEFQGKTGQRKNKLFPLLWPKLELMHSSTSGMPFHLLPSYVCSEKLN